MGGAWDEALYLFGVNDARDPFSRTISLGFRCVRRLEPPPAASYAPLEFSFQEVGSSKPVDDKTYRVFAAYHQYQPSELESRVDLTDNTSPYSTSETVSFRAAYANDRVIAHLFLPKSAVPPYQVVIVFGGADIMSAKHMEDLQYGYPYEFLIRTGRAVMIPAYWGTLERGPSEWFLPSQQERERSLKWSWDLSRSVDYLQARRDIDATKIGFYAISWGAAHVQIVRAPNKDRFA